MYEDLIERRSVAELRQAAAGGVVYYSCERFEDAYGRLVVGVGARLEGRTLEHVARSGRDTVYASPGVHRGQPDGAAGRGAVPHRAAPAPAYAGAEEGEGQRGPDVYSGLREGVPAPVKRALGEALQAVYEVCPDAVRMVEKLRPSPRDLMHGAQVAFYARRLMEAYSRARETGLVSAGYPYPAAARKEVFLAGVVHDVGRWKGRPVKGHAANGAQVLRRRMERSHLLHALAGVVAQHHPSPAIALRGPVGGP